MHDNILPDELDKRISNAVKLRHKSESCNNLIDCIDGRSLRYRSKKNLIKDIVDNIYISYDKCASADKLIEHLLAPYAIPIVKKSKIIFKIILFIE